MRQVLLNPGPVTLSERVRRALLKPDLCHREPEYFVLQESVRSRLLDVYDLPPAAWTSALVAGSGTAAMEAMIASLVPLGGRLLVIENGVYGERLSSIARAHEIDLVTISHSWGAPIDEAAVGAALEKDGAITHVALVHHETTTGRLNDLKSIGALCRAKNVRLLVDGVSSFGGEEIDFSGWGIDACAATANKCLHAVPGVSFVVARRELLAGAESPARTVYLDLHRAWAEQDRGSTLFTPPVHVLYALSEALSELFEQGGWTSRRAAYRALADQVREGLAKLGIRTLIPATEASAVLRSYLLPTGVDYGTLHDGLKERGFIVYAGQGRFATEIFRVSTMGDLRDTDMARFLTATGEVLVPDASNL